MLVNTGTVLVAVVYATAAGGLSERASMPVPLWDTIRGSFQAILLNEQH